jgi:hypothetical protein
MRAGLAGRWEGLSGLPWLCDLAKTSLNYNRAAFMPVKDGLAAVPLISSQISRCALPLPLCSMARMIRRMQNALEGFSETETSGVRQ